MDQRQERQIILIVLKSSAWKKNGKKVLHEHETMVHAAKERRKRTLIRVLIYVALRANNTYRNISYKIVFVK